MDGYLNEKVGKRGELASLRVWTEIGRPSCMCAISPSLGLTRPRVSKAATSQPEISKPRDRRSNDRRLAFHPVRFHSLSFLSRLHLPAPHTCPLSTTGQPPGFILCGVLHALVIVVHKYSLNIT